jgi:hypothetical protein
MSAPHRASSRKPAEPAPSTAEIRVGKPVRKPKPSYPVAKKHTPPETAEMPALPPEQGEDRPRDPQEQQRRKKLLLIGAALALLLLVCVIIVGSLLSGGRIDKDGAVALQNLKVAQRTWWDTQGVAQGVKDPDGALAKLQQSQREWWENEGVARKGKKDGAESLARLEEMQRSWLKSEGLTTGQPPKDPAGALARLEELNRQWWKGESLAVARNDPAGTGGATDDDDPSSGSAEPSGSFANAPDLASLRVKLADKDGTRRFLGTGGTVESEEAVQLGLQWLAAQQASDGSWSREGGGRGGRGASEMTTTALALLPFLARGETHKGSETINTYTKQVERGLMFLIAHQRPDGDLRGGSNMYTHALATMALCEAYSLSGDPLLKGPCQRAVDFLLKAQARDGGWRYTVAPASADLSVSSWCLMALKSGQMAGIIIPPEVLEKATGFLRHVSRDDGGYGYTKGSPGHSPPQPAVMTAAGLVCRQYLQSTTGHAGGTEDVRSPAMTRGVDIILKNPPKPNIKNFYYWYYATYAVLPIGGEAWKQWNPQVRDLIVSMQNKNDPKLKGSWDPQGAYQLTASGRVGVTSLALLTLEVYYRHLPLNRPELGEMAKDLSKTTK